MAVVVVAAQCIPFRGQLGIYEGEGRVQYPYFDSQSELHVQDVEASCSCDTEVTLILAKGLYVLGLTLMV
jgi:hypothetical protein